jgi:xanthine dehydrogenase accessory factor
MIDFNALRRAVECHGTVVRLVLAEVEGSAPRDAGVSMMIWDNAHEGTIGGGRLEFEAIAKARRLLAEGSTRWTQQIALYADHVAAAQGRVRLVYELFDSASLQTAQTQAERDGVYLRGLETSLPIPPELEGMRRSKSTEPASLRMRDGWLAEPIRYEPLAVYIYGAGHVGRALAVMLAPFEQFDICLCDVREEQFGDLPDTITQSWDMLPTDIMASAADDAAHLIMTPEPDYDLELCHRLLNRSFSFAGLVGSARKWEQFRVQLQERGHNLRQIDRVHCPVGDPGLGKHPQAIAVGIAAQLLHHQSGLMRRQAGAV